MAWPALPVAGSSAAITGGPLALGGAVVVVVVVVLEIPGDVEGPLPLPPDVPCGVVGAALCAEVAGAWLGPPPLAARSERDGQGAGRHQDHGGHAPTRRSRAGCAGRRTPGGVTRGPETGSGEIVVERDVDRPGRRTPFLHLAGSARRRGHGAESSYPGRPRGVWLTAVPMGIVTDHSPTPREPISRPDVSHASCSMRPCFLASGSHPCDPGARDLTAEDSRLRG